jgi:hypothetical protein
MRMRASKHDEPNERRKEPEVLLYVRTMVKRIGERMRP